MVRHASDFYRAYASSRALAHAPHGALRRSGGGGVGHGAAGGGGAAHGAGDDAAQVRAKRETRRVCVCVCYLFRSFARGSSLRAFARSYDSSATRRGVLPWHFPGTSLTAP